MLTFLAALVQLSLVVFIHELGHYFFARLAGVRVISFNIGFGKVLWSIQRGGTLYALRCIPVGGYVLLAEKSVKNSPAVPPNECLENNSWLGRFGIISGGALFNILFAWAVFLYLALRQWPFWPAIYKSVWILLRLLKEFVREIILMFARGNFAGLSGPIGVLHMSAQSVRYGWVFFCLNAAFLSVNLGIINLLPFPALDGGRLFFLFYELLFRRKPNPQVENFIHLLGFIVLLTAILVISFLDLHRL